MTIDEFINRVSKPLFIYRMNREIQYAYSKNRQAAAAKLLDQAREDIHNLIMEYGVSNGYYDDSQ